MTQINYNYPLVPITQNVYVLSSDVSDLSTEVGPNLDNSRIDQLSTENGLQNIALSSLSSWNDGQDVSLSTLSTWNQAQDVEIDDVWDAVIKVSSGQTTRYISDNNLSTLGGLSTWETYQDNPGGTKTTIVFNNYQQIPIDVGLNLSSIAVLDSWNWRGIQAPVQGITKKQTIDLRIRQNEYTGGNSYKGNIYISSRLGRWVSASNIVYWETNWSPIQLLPENESLLSFPMQLSADLSQAVGDRLIIQMGQVRNASHERGVNLYVEDDTLSQWRFDPGTVTVSVSSKADKLGVGYNGEILVQDSIGNLSQSGQYLSTTVLTTSQSLSSAQQQQARTNIKAVGYDTTNPTVLTGVEAVSTSFNTGQRLDTRFTGKLNSYFYNFRKYGQSPVALSSSATVNGVISPVHRITPLSSHCAFYTQPIYGVPINQSNTPLFKLSLPYIDTSKFASFQSVISYEQTSLMWDCETSSKSLYGIEISTSGARIIQMDGGSPPTVTRSQYIDAQNIQRTYLLCIGTILTLKSPTGASQTLANPQLAINLASTQALYILFNARTSIVNSTNCIFSDSETTGFFSI